jgi:DNA mismatch repair ATPase MutS
MQCIVHDDDGDHDTSGKGNVIFLYTLGPGQCPKSFGINVARLAGLPPAAVANAKVFSENFEKEMTSKDSRLVLGLNPSDATALLNDVMQSIEDGDESKMNALWKQLQK